MKFHALPIAYFRGAKVYARRNICGSLMALSQISTLPRLANYIDSDLGKHCFADL